MKIGPDWHEEIVLRDGRRARLRIIRPDDKEQLAVGLARLSPHTRFARFHVEKSTLSEHELRYLTEFDGVDHLAIGASLLDGDEETEGLGVGRFVRLRDRPGVAEAAIVVADSAQGQGIGRRLLARLVTAARERGIERFMCGVLVDNEPMRALLQKLAPDAEQHLEDGILEVEWKLDGMDDDEKERSSSLQKLLALVAQGLLRVRSWVAVK